MQNQHWLKEVIILDFFGKEFRWENLGQVNILVGPNGSGKTTVLENLEWIVRGYNLPYRFITQNRWKSCKSGKDAIEHLFEVVDTFTSKSNPAKILIIDLIELHLDLATQKTIIDKLLEANPNVQLFITTHSASVFSQGYMDCRKNISELIH